VRDDGESEAVSQLLLLGHERADLVGLVQDQESELLDPGKVLTLEDPPAISEAQMAL
jgi:hypothetical protein